MISRSELENHQDVTNISKKKLEFSGVSAGVPVFLFMELELEVEFRKMFFLDLELELE